MVRSVALSCKFYRLPGKENTEDVTIRVTCMIYCVAITTCVVVQPHVVKYQVT